MLLARLGAALEGRYRVERQLGAGGMATVFLAEDLRHARKVAIKVLHEELAAVIGAERFLSEIRTTAALQHPHILPLIDSGDASGVPFYVMPYVSGETLRERLQRERQMPVGDAVRIAREVAAALDHAHRQGVVHRDIKPENILLQDGVAIVADFGIALAVSGAGSQRLTQTGLSLGTPSYMSPEQATGEREITARADIYALGAVTYEMLAGEPPFTGPTAQVIIARLVTEEPRPLATQRPSLPPAAAAVVHRALAKVPADRFATTGEFARALEEAIAAPVTGGTAVTTRPTPSAPAGRRRAIGIASAVAAVALFGVATALVVRGSRAGSTPAATATTVAPSVAVLPFTDVGGGKDQFLGDGISETLIAALSELRDLRVAGRTSAFTFRDRRDDMRTIAEQLDVATVLDGSVQRAGDRVRITARLVNASDGFVLWSRTFDAKDDDIFAVQDEVARAVVQALRPAAGEAGQMVTASTRSSAAYEAYLLGRFHWNQRTVDGLRQAAADFERAVALDSTFALAWSGLADTYGLWIPREYNVPDLPGEEAERRAERAARRAVALDSTLAETWTSLAQVLASVAHDWTGAERAFQRAIALNDRYPTAHQWLGNVYHQLGRVEDAVREIRIAHDLDPLSRVVVLNLAAVHSSNGDRNSAEAMYAKLRAIAPDWLFAAYEEGLYWLTQRRDTARAIPLIRKSIELATRDAALGQRFADGMRDATSRQRALELAVGADSRADYRFVVHQLFMPPAEAFAELAAAADTLPPGALDPYSLRAFALPELRHDPRLEAVLRSMLRPRR